VKTVILSPYQVGEARALTELFYQSERENLGF